MIRKWRFGTCAVWILAALFLVGGCSNGANQEMADNLMSMRGSVVESEPIAAKLIETCSAQIESIGEYWDEYDRAIRAGEAMPEIDSEELLAQTRQIYDELLVQIDALGALESADALERTGKAGFDDTADAYKMYLSDLKRSAEDVKSVFDYLFDVEEALLPLTEFEYVENTSGYEDYALMAGQMSLAVSQVQKNLAAITYPDFMRGSHSAIAGRIDEFQGYSQDFSIAVQLSDPLRLASCVYRADRISLLLTEDERSMDDDFMLQFEHAVNRLKGRVATTHDELIENIDSLLSAIG